MTTTQILEAPEMTALCDEIIPPCNAADGGSSSAVQRRLLHIFCEYRPGDHGNLLSLFTAALHGNAHDNPYFETFAEVVTEAYWTSDIGMAAVGFKKP